MNNHKIGYILKVYPRFSETFVVSEILGREESGEDIAIYALRPTTDTRFHPELARVKAPVTWIPRPAQATGFWNQLASSLKDEDMVQNFARILPELSTLAASDVAQGIKLARQAREDGITHFHAHFASLAGRMAWVSSKLTGIGYTVTTHAKDIFHEQVDEAWLKRICEDADHVIAISKYNQKFLEDRVDANIILRYNALELARFPFAPSVTPNDELQIAAVGRLVPKKGFDVLIHALKQLKDEGYEFHLKLAGDGELREELSSLVERLGLSGEVTMLGPLTQQEVTELNRGADVFVAPCVPAQDGNMDGLPTVVLEAMAVGTPVIATNVTGLPEVITETTGVLINHSSADELAAALRSFADQQVDIPNMTHNARALIEEHFDNRQQSKVLAELEGRN